MNFSNKKNDVGLLLLRLTIGLLMLLHGISKIMHPESIEGIQNLVNQVGLPSFFSYGVYVGEVLVPILIILGIATRASALVFAFNMLVAVLLVHSKDIFSLSSVGGWSLELQALYFFGALVLVFTGAGRYAVCRRCWVN